MPDSLVPCLSQEGNAAVQDPIAPEDLQHNRDAWNRMAAAEHALTRVARDEEFQDPLKVIDASGWLSEGIKGWNVLCLAAGGGRHGPLYAAAGARFTVVISARRCWN